MITQNCESCGDIADCNADGLCDYCDDQLDCGHDPDDHCGDYFCYCDLD